MPLYEAHRAFVLGARVLHADETPMALLDPGAGKTRRGLYVGLRARRLRPRARRGVRLLRRARGQIPL